MSPPFLIGTGFRFDIFLVWKHSKIEIYIIEVVNHIEF